jgi:demethoxyubiquinone hydroxylase (CLK1/Coq7/Cat5 family)
MLRRVALVRTDVSEEFSASIIRVTRIGELGTTLAVTSNRRTLLSAPELKQLKHAANKWFVFLRSVRRLLVTANVVPSLSILVNLMM